MVDRKVRCCRASRRGVGASPVCEELTLLRASSAAEKLVVDSRGHKRKGEARKWICILPEECPRENVNRGRRWNWLESWLKCKWFFTVEICMVWSKSPDAGGEGSWSRRRGSLGTGAGRRERQ